MISIILNDKNSIPQLGVGVFDLNPRDCQRVIEDALEIGYRHIDTAYIYNNENAVAKAINNSGIPRNEIFITTKLWPFDQGHLGVEDALKKSLEKLNTGYVDLYLIHWPAPLLNEYVQNWTALEKIKNNGLSKSIGVSNFEKNHLESLISLTDIIPAVNQIELHPIFQQKQIRSFQEPLGIVTQAWAPLGQAKYELAELPGLADIAKAHGKSIAQVVLRWHLQEGVVIFPKTKSRDHLLENFNIFDFTLTEKEIDLISILDSEQRLGPHPNDFN